MDIHVELIQLVAMNTFERLRSLNGFKLPGSLFQSPDVNMLLAS